MRTNKPEFYTCPRYGEAKLPKGHTFIKALCDAGCGSIIVYPLDNKSTTPKVCITCAEWLAYPMGNA